MIHGEAGRRAMEGLWKELVAVQAIGAWRSTVGLAGQILETSVKIALVQDPGSITTVRQSRSLHFDKAIDRAVERGLFAAPAGITVVGGLHSARQRRNLASHFSPDERSRLDEKQATFNLAALVCFYEALASREDLAQLGAGWPQDVQEARGRISRCAQGEPLPAGVTWRSLFETVLPWTAPRSCVTLCGVVLRSDRIPREELADALNSWFHIILSRSARSHVNDVVELIGRLRALRMTPHALVLASLLPLDNGTLRSVIGTERPLGKTHRYLEYCKLADPHFYAASICNDGTVRMITELLRDRLEVRRRERSQGDEEHEEHTVGDRFGSEGLSDVLAVLPLKAQHHIWHGGFADELVTALLRKPPVSYGHFLARLRPEGSKTSAVFRRAQRKLSEALVDRCRTEDLRSLPRVLDQIPEFTDPEGPLAYAVAEALCRRLERERVDEEVRTMLRERVEILFPQLVGI